MKQLLDNVDLDGEVAQLKEELKTASGQKRTRAIRRSEEHTSELQSLGFISYAVFCLKKKKKKIKKIKKKKKH